MLLNTLLKVAALVDLILLGLLLYGALMFFGAIFTAMKKNGGKKASEG
jgi:hypothetical protein